MPAEIKDNQVSRQRSDAFRAVAEWAWKSRVVPSEIHDAAAFALDRPSLAHGVYTPSTAADVESKTNDDACEE